MHFAVILSTALALIASFDGEAVGKAMFDATFPVTSSCIKGIEWLRGKWPRDVKRLGPDITDDDGIVQNPEDPMRCVDLYYKAVINGNYKQYQFCVREPMSVDQFNARVKSRSEVMRKSGLKQVKEPVRGRTTYKEIQGARRTTVFAISPWTNTYKEEKYVVVEVGQGWRIDKENLK